MTQNIKMFGKITFLLLGQKTISYFVTWLAESHSKFEFIRPKLALTIENTRWRLASVVAKPS